MTRGGDSREKNLEHRSCRKIAKDNKADMEFEAYTIMRSENMKKIWIVAMTMCILLTGCGSKKQVKKADWKTDKILATTSYHQQTGWADSIIENKKYVIYTRKDRKIIRYDKETGEKEELLAS